MADITITNITHAVDRIVIRRRDHAYHWHWWRKDTGGPRVRYAAGRPVPLGEVSLKTVEIVPEGASVGQSGFVPLGSGQYPTRVNRITIELSNHSTLTVHDTSISYVRDNADWFLHKRRHNIKMDSTRFGTLRITLPDGVVVNHEQALHLKVGQIVKRAKPLRLDLAERCVTDGNYRFPLARPFGSNWRWSGISFVQSVTATNWLLLLKAVHGLYAQETLDIKQVRTRMQVIKRRRRNRDRIQQVGQRVGQCFGGHKAIHSVSFGKNLLFTLRRGEEQIFVVDSPEYASALYVFDDEQNARAWASRAIDWREARKRAKLVQIHRGNWKEQVALALA